MEGQGYELSRSDTLICGVESLRGYKWTEELEADDGG